MKGKTLPEIATELFHLLEPLSKGDRGKVVRSAMALLDDTSDSVVRDLPDDHVDRRVPLGEEFGRNANRWMQQNNLTREMLDEAFHYDNGSVDVIAATIPGKGKKGQSKNCYLLCGIAALLSNDDPRFVDDDAVELCKRMGCHDAKNHATTRKELGNTVSGTKASGFTLPAPGLRAAAQLVKEIASNSHGEE